MEDYKLFSGQIETYTGKLFTLDNPVFDIKDIAHALSLTCRYGGQCSKFYSVAEHSVMVSDLMVELDLGSPLEGLLHDATEAYLSDVPAPFKQYLPDWAAIDEGLEAALAQHFDLPWPRDKGYKTADWLALHIEGLDIMHSGGEWFNDPEGIREQAKALHKDGIMAFGLPPKEAEHLFLTRYEKIQEQAGT